jgi:hypothetical protein
VTVFYGREQYLGISKGEVLGTGKILKFGRNPVMASGAREEIWDGTGAYTFPATADITHLHSTDSADTSINIEVEGLDTNYALVVQEKALDAADAQTPVALDTPIRRVFRKKNIDSTDLVGDVHATNAGDTVEYGVITVPFNQTQMAMYTVPAGKTAYLTRYYGMVNKKQTASVEIEVYVRPFGQVFQLKHNGVIASGGDAHWDFSFFPSSPPMKIEEKSDIKIVGIASAAGVDTSAGFDLIIVDN